MPLRDVTDKDSSGDQQPDELPRHGKVGVAEPFHLKL